MKTKDIRQKNENSPARKTIPNRSLRGINPESVRGWIVNIYWQQAFGSLFRELASTAEMIARSVNRK